MSFFLNSFISSIFYNITTSSIPTISILYDFNSSNSYVGSTVVRDVHTRSTTLIYSASGTLSGSYNQVWPYMQFNGGNLKPTNPIPSSYFPNKNLSFGIWIYPTSTDCAILEEKGAGAYSCGMINLTGSSIIFGTWNGGVPAGVSAPITINRWNYINWVYSASLTALKGYIGGTLVATMTGARIPASNTGSTTFGLFTAGGNFNWYGRGNNSNTAGTGRIYTYEMDTTNWTDFEILDKYKSTKVPLYMKNPVYNNALNSGSIAFKALYINYFYAPTAGTYSFTMSPSPKVSPLAIDDACYVSFDNETFSYFGLNAGSTPFSKTLTQGMHKVIIYGVHVFAWGTSLAFIPNTGQFYTPINIKDFIGSSYANISTPTTNIGLVSGVQGMIYLGSSYTAPTINDIIQTPSGIFEPKTNINFDVGDNNQSPGSQPGTWPNYALINQIN
jgi:hypothetical protein